MRRSSQDETSMNRTKFCALTLAVLSLLQGCGGGGADTVTQPPPPPPPPPTAGLDQRPGNPDCVAPARATGNSLVAVERAFPNLTFSEPVALVQAPGDRSRWFIIEKRGIIRVFENSPAVSTTQVFLDIRGRVFPLDQSEAGLLGIAFHPDFANNRRVYINYITDIIGGVVHSITAEFTSPDGGLTLDPSSERVLLDVTKQHDNHNGGQLAFDSDGYLRIGLGDGGGSNDPQDNAQNNMRLLGKMLRIDVDSRPGGEAYGIPADNPYASNPRCNADGTGTQNCPEIYASGLRNPWRWSFDRQTGVQWVGDVGQSAFEEVDIIERGGNYGWDVREGFSCAGGGQNCPSAGFVDPVADYDRAMGHSITGGYVYRGSQTTELFGRYLFADFVTGMIASLTPDAGGTYSITQHVPPGGAPSGAPGQLSISTFAEDNDGELYVVDFVSGHIYRLIFTPGGGGGDNIPQLLSATGCINTSGAGAPPLLSLIPYRINAPFWSDGAVKERWMGLPNGLNIGAQEDDWDFPNGTVLIKHFRLNNQLIETRLFMRHPDGVWAGYTYEWNQAESEANRVSGGKTVAKGGQSWTYPSEAECMQCHTQVAGFSLGLETAQLNGDHLYPQTGRTANQITTLNSINVLSPPIGANPPMYTDPSNTNASLNDRARVYLHTNCANCHQPQGPTPVTLDLRHSTALRDTGACDIAPSAGDLGITDARIVAPGNSSQSVLLARMSRRDANAMPPLGSNVRDAAGESLIDAWIGSLTAADCQ